jgi:hypothetical protein
MGWTDLEKRLAQRFGLGTNPLITKRLYRRLQREVDAHGEAVAKIISECAESSSTALVDRGAWFRSAVVGRLREAGFLTSGARCPRGAEVAKLREKLASTFAGADGRDAGNRPVTGGIHG